MEIATQNQNRIMIKGVKERISDILMTVSWREIARNYFGKSSSWLYHKLDGNDSAGGFSEAEAQQLRNALNDLAKRLQTAANNI